MNKKCSRPECEREAKHQYSNSSHYCDMHLRFMSMRSVCQQRGMEKPSMRELDNMLRDLNGMVCPTCNTMMVWMTPNKGKKVNVITLQHWNDGRMSFICHSCNVRHGLSKLGDRLFDIRPSEKFCPSCDQVKPVTEFYNNKCRKDGKDYCCKPCNRSRNKRYLTSRATKPNEKGE